MPAVTHAVAKSDKSTVSEKSTETQSRTSQAQSSNKTVTKTPSKSITTVKPEIKPEASQQAKQETKPKEIIKLAAPEQATPDAQSEASGGEEAVASAAEAVTKGEAKGGNKGDEEAAKKAPKKPAGKAAAEAGPVVKLQVADPKKDPKFKATMGKLGRSAAKARSHEPAAKKSSEAQSAAKPPKDEKLASANANKAKAMDAAKTGKPEPASFLSMLRAEIQKVMPKKTSGVKSFMKGNDRDQLKNAMSGNVKKQKTEATAGMKDASDAPPDTAAVKGKEVTPLPAASAPPKSQGINARGAMPDPKSEQETSFDQGKKDTDELMTDANVTTTQMEKANDPQFSAVVSTKSEADSYADAAPQQYQAKEKAFLTKSTAQAGADEKKGLLGFKAEGAKAIKNVHGRQLTTKEKDELERKKVTDHIQTIFTRTKTNVDNKLTKLDEEVTKMFDKGADTAVSEMKDYVEDRFDDRYSGISGKALWLKDKVVSLPGKVKAWFTQAHKVFLKALDNLVVSVAALVEKRLKEAKDEITKGQKEIREYVDGLPDNLKTVGEAAEKEMQDNFKQLQDGVNSKKNELAQKLAQRYKAASEKGAKALQELKDAHKSLYERVRDAIARVVKILRDFKNRVLALLKKSKKAIEIIVSDPIGFLKNVLAAIKKGLGQFVDNIWAHLKAGFMAWLFGSLGESGVEVPKDFSLGSLLKLVLQVLGLTYARLRTKAIKVLGERGVTVIEHVAKYIWTLVTEGPAKLWEMIKEKLGNLKEMIINAIQEWIVTTIIKAAVLKLVSMFNPVGAIIQAILMIYNVVMFLIERIQQILAFVESVINSIYEIAIGAIGTAANWIEKALARAIPIMIAFLARLLGITGIASKIVGIIKKIQSKVDKALDFVIAKVAKGIGSVVGGAKAGAAKVFAWWKKRLPFKGKDGKKHEVYFKGKGATADIIVASTPLVLEKYLVNLDESTLDANQKKAVSSIKKDKKEIDKIKKDTKGSFGKGQGERISKLLTQISVQLPKLGGTEEKPPSVVSFGTKNVMGSPIGTLMVANPLSINPGGLSGSQPFDKSALWIAVNHRTGAYIRGHLLNHHVHGPGSNENLVPITGSLNTTMESQVESKVKHAVLSENKVVKYEVKAHFGQPARRHLPAESELPTKLTFKAEELEKKNNTWVPNGKSLPITGSLPHNLPPDEDVGVVHSEVNLSESTKDKLIEIPGVGSTLADRIIELRKTDGSKFHTYDSLAEADGIGKKTVDFLRGYKWVKVR